MILTIIPIMPIVPIVSAAAEEPTETRSTAARATSEGTVCGDLLILNGGTYGAYFTYDAQNDQVILISSVNTVTIKNADPDKQSSTGIKIDCDGDITICLAGVDIKTMGKPAIEIRENTTYDVTIEVVEGTVNELRTGGEAIISKNCNNEDAGWLYFTGSGTLKAIYNKGGGWGAAIGSDRNKCTRNIEFKGPTIWAHGQSSGAGIGSGAIDDDAVIEAQPYTAQNIIISAGNIEVYGTSGSAAIGGAGKGGAKNIVISGGTVTANGSMYGAAIGAGAHVEYSGSDRTEVGAPVDGITITGGTVTAVNEFLAAAIGGSVNSTVKNITISGGTVVTISEEEGENDTSIAAGIGAGVGSTVSNITISGGTVHPNGLGDQSDDIGIGGNSGTCTNFKITGGSVNAPKMGCQPKNDKGENVYLMTIPNPENKDVFVNGNKWNPCNSSALNDTNLYLYIPKDETVRLLDQNVHYHFADGVIKTDIWEDRKSVV